MNMSFSKFYDNQHNSSDYIGGCFPFPEHNFAEGNDPFTPTIPSTIPSLHMSSVMSVCFARFHPNLVVGGTYSGQIVLWDNRSHRRTPVQRTPLSAAAHTHPVYCVNVVGTQNAHNLITVSTDGKMCSWSLDMLSTPQESMELVYNKSKPVAVTGMAFPTGDVNNFVVGSEEGTVYTACRHGSKAGIGEVFEGHQGPVTGINCHMAVGPIDFSHLFVTSSFDWTVKLWTTKRMVSLGTALIKSLPGNLALEIHIPSNSVKERKTRKEIENHQDSKDHIEAETLLEWFTWQTENQAAFQAAESTNVQAAIFIQMAGSLLQKSPESDIQSSPLSVPAIIRADQQVQEFSSPTDQKISSGGAPRIEQVEFLKWDQLKDKLDSAYFGSVKVPNNTLSHSVHLVTFSTKQQFLPLQSIFIPMIAIKPASSKVALTCFLALSRGHFAIFIFFDNFAALIMLISPLEHPFNEAAFRV
ncbi:hypothetical protein P7K49_025334 [Saguinus oedipus]|uniref:Cytoplasmic dynein 1 intermediate chain 1 n=1 Tax=Saguinus oedipus TaxID=9490 RepID=A0ABQ9UHS8_SAGOE|nr:hypothetical protein P7K49_025334 [Saguinus oedipus]